MEFKKTQENGDATSNYIVTTNKKTVIEFLYELRKKNQIDQEWGSVFVTTKTELYNKIAEYTRQSIQLTNLITKYGNRTITHIWANGGWGAMTYYITIEE